MDSKPGSATYKRDNLRQVIQHSLPQFSCLYMVDCYKTALDKIHISKCMHLCSLLPHTESGLAL